MVSNEKGMVLVVSLLIMVVLILLGTTAVMTTTTDLKISSNYKQSEKAFYNAEAGIQEARERLKGTSSTANYAGDPASSADSVWCSYIITSTSWNPAEKDPSYNSSYSNYFPTSSSPTSTTLARNSLQTAMSYFVKIRHKKEYDAELDGHTSSLNHYYDDDGSTSTHTFSSPGSIIYYGYKDSSSTTIEQFSTSTSTDAKPVEIITAYGVNGSSQKILEAEVVRPPGPKVKSTVYAKGNVTGNGSSLVIDGNDSCSAVAAISPVYLKNPGEFLPNGANNGPPNLLGNPAQAEQGSMDINILDIVNSMKSSATVTITEDKNNGTYGNTSTYVSLVLGILSSTTPATSEAAFYIYMKNGGRILTPRCWHQNNQIFFNYYGGEVGIEKDTVKRIETTDGVFVNQCSQNSPPLLNSRQEVKSTEIKSAEKISKTAQNNSPAKSKEKSHMLEFTELRERSGEIQGMTRKELYQFSEDIDHFRDKVLKNGLGHIYSEEIYELITIGDRLEKTIKEKNY